MITTARSVAPPAPDRFERPYAGRCAVCDRPLWRLSRTERVDDKNNKASDTPIWHEHETGWTREDDRAAHAEGWSLFDASGSCSGPWQVQMFDEPLYDWSPGDTPLPDLGDEMVAWVTVRRASTAQALAVLAFLEINNPLEFERIRQWPTIVEGEWDYDTDRVRWGPPENGARE